MKTIRVVAAVIKSTNEKGSQFFLQHKEGMATLRVLGISRWKN